METIRTAAASFQKDMTNVTRRHLIRSAAALFCSQVLRGQEEPTFSTDVKVVNVLATVTTKKGQIIRDLTKDDFSLAENGRPQTIRYFSRETDLPLTIGLLIDTSDSQLRVVDAERHACARFIDQVLRPDKDQVFIAQFDMAMLIRQPLTSSLKKLDDGLVAVDTPSREEYQHQIAGGTLLYDAVLQASKDIMLKQQGRKALIVLSDGVDTGSEAPLSDAIDMAQRADTLVYSILFSDSGYYGGFLGGPDGRRVLQRMSHETGAECFEVSKKQGIEQIFDTIQDELRSQYSIGYVSDQPVRISEFRKIALTVDQKGLIVQSRNRYWARR
jgi:VWFA-related protein